MTDYKLDFALSDDPVNEPVYCWLKNGKFAKLMPDGTGWLFKCPDSYTRFDPYCIGEEGVEDIAGIEKRLAAAKLKER